MNFSCRNWQSPPLCEGHATKLLPNLIKMKTYFIIFWTSLNLQVLNFNNDSVWKWSQDGGWASCSWCLILRRSTVTVLIEVVEFFHRSVGTLMIGLVVTLTPNVTRTMRVPMQSLCNYSITKLLSSIPSGNSIHVLAKTFSNLKLL